MRVYTIQFKPYYDNPRIATLAAKTFHEAVKRLPALIRKVNGRGKYTILSVVETAKLDG